MTQNLSFEQRLDANIVATMINVRVQAALPGFIGRCVRADEINEFAVGRIRRGFHDREQRVSILQHVYQCVIGSF